ncbi:MAG: LLM class flavin-dependent oxidoreductase [Alphaproteobacteria bacterium]|nr:LLM class flavin-dependent oxidoreductase [Alphaproteobacteria bacterium]MCB9931416.1 LLM class flavin-dependent oxidoreductase [Alphaproteobacteria bacterium]
MKFSICVMANIDEIGFFNHVEALGYHAVWVTDSQMLFSDCYAVLALAARQTSRLQLGTGTAITGTRIAPVHAAAAATLNRIAPGRIHIGIGTGNTAMRTMGQRPMRIAAYREYLRALSGLLRGETLDYTHNGVTKPVKLLMHDETGFMNLEPKIPLYVSGFGPRAMGLAGEFGDGLVFAIPPRGVAVPEALGHVRQGAASVGRSIGADFRNCALTNIALLQPGEAVDSDRIKALIGPNVMASVYYFYDEVHERGVEVLDFLKPIWKPYCALVEDTAPELRHLRTHEFHYTYLHPGEAELITADLIRATCLVGVADDLVEQVQDLERQGLQEIMWAAGTQGKWRFAEDFARQVMSRV